MEPTFCNDTASNPSGAGGRRGKRMTSHNEIAHNHITHTCIIDYVCMYIQSVTHAHNHTHTYTHTHAHTHTCTHTHICTHTCTHTHICTHTCIHTHTYAQHACFSCCDIHLYDVTDYAAGHSYGHVHVAHLGGGGGGGGGGYATKFT